MPEESEKSNEEKELSEQDLADEEAAFAGEETPEKETPKPEEKEEEPAEEEPEADDTEPPEEEEEPAEEEEEEEAEEEESALTRMDKRAQELFEDEKEPEGKPAPAPPAKPSAEKVELTKEQMAGYLEAFPVDALPDEIYIGNRVINLKDLAEKDEDIFNAIAVMSGTMSQKMVAQQLKEAGFVSREDHQKAIGEIQQQLEIDWYWREVERQHPDAWKIDQTPEFREWLNGQPMRIKRLAVDPDPENGILVLDAYKETIAKKKAAEHDDAAGASKKRKDDLHKGTLRTKKSVAGKTKPGDMDDEEAGWREAGKKK